MYSLQIDAFGNRIVCKGSSQRTGYHLVFVGSYAECQMYRSDSVEA